MIRWRRDRPPPAAPLPGAAKPAVWTEPPLIHAMLPRRIWLSDLEKDSVPVMVASLRAFLARFNVVVPESVLNDQVYVMLEYAGIVVPGGALETHLYGLQATDHD